MKSIVAVTLLIVVSPAAAERRTNGVSDDGCRHCDRKRPGDYAVEASFGIGRTSAASEAQTTGDLAAGFGAFLATGLALTLRGHVLIGTDATLTTLGIDLRKTHGGYFIAMGPAIGRAHGPADIDALVADLDARFGITLSRVNLSIDLLVGHAVANDSIDADLAWLSRAGLSLGADF